MELRLGEGEGTGKLRIRGELMSGDAGWIEGELGSGSAAGSVFDLVRVCDGVRGAAVDGVRPAAPAPAAPAFVAQSTASRLSIFVVVVGVLWVGCICA